MTIFGIFLHLKVKKSNNLRTIMYILDSYSTIHLANWISWSGKNWEAWFRHRKVYPNPHEKSIYHSHGFFLLIETFWNRRLQIPYNSTSKSNFFMDLTHLSWHLSLHNRKVVICSCFNIDISAPFVLKNQLGQTNRGNI